MFKTIIGEANAVTESEPKNNEEVSSKQETKVPEPRPLHRTSSIFLRNLAPSITRGEIENVRWRSVDFKYFAIFILILVLFLRFVKSSLVIYELRLLIHSQNGDGFVVAGLHSREMSILN